MASRSFPGIFIGMLAPFLIWAAHFGVVYGINGMVCARRAEGALLFGFPLSVALVGIATLLALGWVAVLLVKAWCGAGPGKHIGAADPRRFARWFAMAGSGAALVSIMLLRASSSVPATCLPAAHALRQAVSVRRTAGLRHATAGRSRPAHPPRPRA